MSAFCPLCLSKGRKTALKHFQINLSETTRMCADSKCPYPFGLAYTDTFIQQNFMDMVKDDSVKLGVESLREPVTFQPLHEMNTTQMEPVKDANLPSTSQSLIPQGNENICELMDLIESDGFSNESVEDMNLNSVAEFESLFKSLVEDISVGNSQKMLPCQDTGLSAASDSNLYTGLTTDSDLKVNTGLPTDSDVRLNTGLSADSDLKLNTGLPTDSDMRLNTGLSADSDLKLNTGLPTDSDMRLNTGLSVDSDLKVNTGLPTDSDMRLNTGLSVDSDLQVNTGLPTDSDVRLNTGLSADIELKLNTVLPTDSDVRRNTGLSADSDLKLNTGLPTDSDMRLNTGLSADSDLKLNTGLPTDSDMRLNTGLSVDSDLQVNTGLPTDSDMRLNTGLSVDSDLQVNTGLPTDSDVRRNTGLSADSDLKLNTGLPTDSDMRLNTGLSADSDLKLNTVLPTDSDLRLNTGLSADSDLKLNTGLPTDSDMRLNTGLSVDSDLKVNTGLPTDSDMRLNTGLPTDSDLRLNTVLSADSDLKVNTGLSVDSDLKVNAGLLTENDLKKVNTELTDNKLKTMNTGSSADSFASGSEGKIVNDVEMEVQLKPSSADTEENNDNILAVTESCGEYAETSDCSKVTAPASNQNQELTVTLLYDVSKHIGSTAAGQPLLNSSPVPATMTLQALDIPQDSVGLKTVAPAAYDDAGTADGEMIISVQSVTKGKVEVNSSNLMTCDSTSAEKSFGDMNAEISHLMTNSDNILTDNRTDVISAEVGTPKVTPYAARDIGELSCTNIRDQNAVSTSPELFSFGETSCSLTVADKVVSEKKEGDGIAEVGIPVSTGCTVREVLDHSYFKVRDENETAVTKHSFVSENSVPVMIDIQDMIQPLSVPDTGNLTVDALSVALDDTNVAENVTVSSCENVNIPSGTEVKETVVRGLTLETDISAAENMFPEIKSIADLSEWNLMTHAGTEVTVTDSDQAMASVVPIMLEKLTSEGNSHTFRTNCVPNTAAETADLKSYSICVSHYTDTTVFDNDILERLHNTTKARHIVTPRSNNTGMDCPQFPVFSSDLQQKETGNRTHLQKPELCSQSRVRSVGMNKNRTLELDGQQYSCSTYEVGLTNSLGRSGAEVTNALVGDSKNHVAPQTVRTGENLNSCDVPCRENMPIPDLSKSGRKVVSATHVTPRVSPTYPPRQQKLNSVQPISSDYSAAFSQKGAKRHTTAPKLFSKPNDVKLCNTQHSKLNTKEANINKIRNCLKSHIAIPDSNKDKFAGFVFEKPFVPGENLKPFSKNKKISKTERLPKGRKIYSEQNELLLTLTNNPIPDPLNCNSSSADSRNRVMLLGNHGSVEDIVANTNVADNVCVQNESDVSLDWLQQLLL